MSESDTKEQILDAAEQIFGAKGFAGTSLRDITRKAGVNLAAVNYHFGSKEGLLRAVLDRRISPVNQKRLKLLAQVEATAGEEPPSVEAILEAYISPSLHLFGSLGKRGMMLMRFFGSTFQVVQVTMPTGFESVLSQRERPRCRLSQAVRVPAPAPSRVP